MNFSQGHSGTKVQCESCFFSQGKTPEFTKMGEIHELFVSALSLVWFAGRLLILVGRLQTDSFQNVLADQRGTAKTLGITAPTSCEQRSVTQMRELPVYKLPTKNCLNAPVQNSPRDARAMTVSTPNPRKQEVSEKKNEKLKT